MSFVSNCPRCGTNNFEKLKTYSHCIECLYFVDYWQDQESVNLKTIMIVEAILSKLEAKSKFDKPVLTEEVA